MRWLIGVGFLCAQPLPDSINFYGTQGETLQVVFQVLSTGWTAALKQRTAGHWQTFRLDTLNIDSTGRPTRYIRYQLHQANWLPETRWQLTYPFSDLIICTIETYQEEHQTFIPQQRLYMWGMPPRWDSLLMGWLAVIGLGWNHPIGSLLCPHPALAHDRLWGDSLLVEEFLPVEQVFIAHSGYIRTIAPSHDTLHIFAHQGRERAHIGYRLLYKNEAGMLTFTQDSVCGTSFCTAEKRLLTYTQGGLVKRDSLIVKSYSNAGVPLNEMNLTRHYEWSSEGLLQKAHYPMGVYEVFYGSQVVSVKKPWHRSPLVASEGYIKGLIPNQIYTLWDLYGRCVWRGEADWEGKSLLPPTLSQGLYILRSGEYQMKVFWRW